MRGLTVVALPPRPAGAVAEPRLVADPAGGAIAAWAEGSDVVVAAIRDGGAREELRVGCAGPPLSIALTASEAPGPTVVWSGHDGTVLACVREGRTWRGPAPLSAPRAGATLVDAAASPGHLAAIWTRSPGVVQAARHVPGEGWIGDGDIGAVTGGAMTPRIAVGPDGEAVAAWVGSLSQVACASRPPCGHWAPEADLTPAGHGASGLRLGMDTGGACVLAWTAADAVVRTARRPAGQLAERRPANWHAAWSAPVAVSGSGDPCYAPRLAVGAGEAVVAWHRADAEVQACTIPPSGAPGPPVALTGERESGLYPSPAAGDGTAAVAWRGDGGLVRLARGGPGGWSEPESMSAPGEAPDPPLIAVDRAGSITIAW